MKEIRNPDGRLVCRINETTGSIEILEKNWITLIDPNKNSLISISHFSKSNYYNNDL